MQDELKEKISCFVDGEIDDRQLLSMIHHLDETEETENTIRRYQLVSQVLKIDNPVKLDQNFATRISQQIKQEPIHFIPSKKPVITWRKTSLAVAASLALVAVFAPKVIKQNIAPPAPMQMAQQVPVQDVALTTPTQLVRLRPNQVNPRLNAYLQAHSNRIYTIGASSYQPYARVAGYRQER
jgi:sigma-E factor negative regulatory protein RseA